MFDRFVFFASRRDISHPEGIYRVPQGHIVSRRDISRPAGTYRFPKGHIASRRDISHPEGIYRVPKGHIVLRSNISYRRYIVNSAGIYIADFIFDEIIIVKILRYTRFARTIYFASQNAIYSLRSYDIFCFAKCDITSLLLGCAILASLVRYDIRVPKGHIVLRK